MKAEVETHRATGDQRPMEVSCSADLARWLAAARVSLVFTTRRAGKLFFVGLNQQGRISIFERSFEQARLLHGAAETLFVSTLFQIWRFENVLADGQQAEGYDRLFVPQAAYTTGNLDIHDVALDSEGCPVFVNTLFNCLATISDRYSFLPVWKPPFISRLVPGDRCHLSGLAMVDGRPAYVTAASTAGEPGAWRKNVRHGGCLVDVATGEIAVAGLSLPHSPRVHGGRLWLLNSGAGYLGYADLERGVFEPIVLCPGYLRGLTFVNKYALVGLSRTRDGQDIGGLALEANLTARKAKPQCAVVLIDLESGELAHWIRLRGAVDEIDDVAVLPDVRRPAAIGLVSDEVCRVVSIGPDMPIAARPLTAALGGPGGLPPARRGPP